MATEGPLSGLRILDVGSIFAGPMVGAHLGDLGAEVIKVEPPKGDDTRRLGLSKDGVPLWWKLVARNKKLLAVDLSRAEGAAVFRRLCSTADVVVENFRTGRFAEWGLSYDELSRTNPRLIMLHISGYGSTGPYKDFPGFGTLAEAFSGFVHMNGHPDGPPTLPSFPIADNVTALFGCYSVLAAILEREKSGRGQEIELSLYESMLSLMGNMVVNYDQLGQVMMRRGNRSAISTPRNAYQTKDGKWIVVTSTTDSVFRRLFTAIGRADMASDPSLATNRQRATRAGELDTVVETWARGVALDEALTLLRAHEVAAAPINDVEQFVNDPHVKANKSLLTHDDPDLGAMRIPDVVPRFSRTPGKIRWTGRLDVGADTEMILKDAGFADDEIRQLAHDGIIKLP